jgi:hypothetical protein
MKTEVESEAIGLRRVAANDEGRLRTATMSAYAIARR